MKLVAAALLSGLGLSGFGLLAGASDHPRSGLLAEMEGGGAFNNTAQLAELEGGGALNSTSRTAEVEGGSVFNAVVSVA